MRNVIIVGSRSLDGTGIRPLLDKSPLLLGESEIVLFLSKNSEVERTAQDWSDRNATGNVVMFENENTVESVAQRTLSQIHSGATLLIALWDGQSAGTRAAIDTMLDAGYAVHVHVEVLP